MSATLILRTVKGTPLTNLELDNNFSNVNAWAVAVGSNVGVVANLTTGAKSNLVSAVNELKGNISNLSADRILNTTSIISITGAAGNILANVAGKQMLSIGNTNANANIVVSGNLVANALHTALLADRSGNVLVIKDEGGNVIWGI